MAREPSLLDDIRQRKKAIKEIVIFAVFLGLSLSLFSSALFSYFWPSPPTSINAILSTSVFFIFTIIAGLFYYSLDNGATETSEIQLLLPLVVRTELVEIKEREKYSPSRFASKFFNRIARKDAEFRKQFITSWREDDTLGIDSGAKFARATLHQLIQRIILALIDNYGEHTLEIASRYHQEYRSYAQKFEKTTLSYDKLSGTLGLNQFKQSKADKQQKFRLPKGFSIIGQKSNFFQDEHCCDLFLKSPYGSIRFQILPYWVRIRHDVRRFMLFTKGMGQDVSKDLCLLQIPITMTIDLKGAKLRSKELEDYYLWMQGLVNDTRRWMDWLEYEKNDMERMVVGLSDGLSEIRKKLEKLVEKM